MSKTDTALTELAVMKTDITYIKEALKTDKKENNDQHAEIKDLIVKFIDGADDKYASKNIEKAFYWVVGSVALILIAALMNGVLR